MKIFVEVPVWLGDAVMASVAICNLASKYPNAKFTVFGSFVSTRIYEGFGFVDKVVVDDSKKNSNRYLNLFKLGRNMGSFDLAFTFRRKSFASKFMFFFIKAKQKFQYKRLNNDSIHQVKRYNDFVNYSLNENLPLGDLQLPFVPNVPTKPLLGINPGATYGNAKRWYPEEFAKVAIALQNKFDIVIFGGPTETQIAGDIEKILLENGISNFVNLAGKTTVKELCETIGSLSLFITNDSGPLHIAAAYKIKTIAIFGPTIAKETNGWQNENEIIVSKKLNCQPCMKRVCPIITHDCMKLITAEDVLEAINK